MQGLNGKWDETVCDELVLEVVKGDAARLLMDQEGLPGDEEDMPEMPHPAPQAAGSGHCTMVPIPLAGQGMHLSPRCSPFAPEEALLLSNYDTQSTGSGSSSTNPQAPPVVATARPPPPEKGTEEYDKMYMWSI